MEKVRLIVRGISYNPIQSGAFALLLDDESGRMRIPVIIGVPEAQSIAMNLEGINSRRPMTHDLIAGIINGFGLRLLQVFIYKFEDGIFLSEMWLNDGEREIRIDARTSDAVAIALRLRAPIFTTPEILANAGIAIDIEGDNDVEGQESEKEAGTEDEQVSVETLERQLADLIANEDYEEAAALSARLKALREQDAGARQATETDGSNTDDAKNNDSGDDSEADFPSLSDLLG